MSEYRRSSQSSSGRRPSGHSGSSSKGKTSGSRTGRSGSRYDRDSDYRYSRSSESRSRSGRSSYSYSGKKKKVKFKSSFYFLCILVVYTAFLLVLSAIFLVYTDSSLKKFEKSQSFYAFEQYLQSFKESLVANELPEGFASENTSAFESSDVILQALLSQTEGKTISYEKDPSSYNTEEPVYDILADGEPIAKVTLSAYNERVVFVILTAMDWKVVKAELVNSGDLTDYTIVVPEGSHVTVNGVTAGNEYITGTVDTQSLFANAAEYITVPNMVEYQIPALSKAPEVVVSDSNGNNLECSLEGTKFSVPFGVESEMPEDLKETALNIAETWSLFNTADLQGASHGLDTVRKFLIPGSFYDELAKGWASGVDITFTSAHTLKNPAFENVNVDHYVRYTDDCFACHIDFDKPMHLTRTGADIVDSTHSTYLFVNYNGTWCMVDMIADKATDTAAEIGTE